MQIETLNFIKNLPQSEKAEVMEYIALDLSREEDDIILAELNRRHEEYLKNPGSAKTWDEVKAELLSRYGT